MIGNTCNSDRKSFCYETQRAGNGVLRVPTLPHHACGTESHKHDALYPLRFCAAMDRRRTLTAPAKRGEPFFLRV